SLLVADVCRQCASRTAIRVPTHLFFSMLQPPPTSTLFPYTTLFRSTQRRIRNHTSIPVMLSVYLYSGKPWGQSPTGHHVARIDRDRKSTRLNSSHVSISYAVFCLKKKIKQTTKVDNEQHNSSTINAI